MIWDTCTCKPPSSLTKKSPQKISAYIYMSLLCFAPFQQQSVFPVVFCQWTDSHIIIASQVGDDKVIKQWNMAQSFDISSQTSQAPINTIIGKVLWQKRLVSHTKDASVHDYIKSEIKYSQISVRTQTLCIVSCYTSALSCWYLWIFYFRLSLTLYRCVFSLFIQQSWLR